PGRVNERLLTSAAAAPAAGAKNTSCRAARAWLYPGSRSRWCSIAANEEVVSGRFTVLSHRHIFVGRDVQAAAFWLFVWHILVGLLSGSGFGCLAFVLGGWVWGPG